MRLRSPVALRYNLLKQAHAPHGAAQSTIAEEDEQMRAKNGLATKLLKRSEIPVLAATLLLCAVFASVSDNFFSAYNVYNIMRTAAIYVFIALAQTSVMMIGGTSLCIGYIGAMAVVTAGHCMQELGMGGAISTVLALAIAAICGLVNGLVITRLKLSAFVTTLATQFIFKGLVTGISKGFPYTSLSPNYADFGRGSFLGIPLIALLAVATLVLVWYILRYTVAGRKLLATGGSLRAAKMAAVNTDRMILIANIASGFFCGVAAVCTMSLNGMGQPTTGTDWMLYSFAVSVIGGTGLAGGVVCPAGLAIAAVLFVIIKNGLVLINANVYFEQTYLGLILLVACSLGVISDMIGAARRRREFRLAQAKKVKQPADAADEK